MFYKEDDGYYNDCDLEVDSDVTYLPYDGFTNDIKISLYRNEQFDLIHGTFDFRKNIPGLVTAISSFDFVGQVGLTDGWLKFDTFICDLNNKFDKLIVLKWNKTFSSFQLVYLKNVHLWNMYDEYSVLYWSLVVRDTKEGYIESSWFRFKPLNYGEKAVHYEIPIFSDKKQLDNRRYYWMYDQMYKQIARYCLEAKNNNDVRSFM